MSRLRYDERGGVFVVSAFLIPVLLLMTALVIDVGNWFTHNRQLQNRADAAAYAAGVEYAGNWKACVSSDAGVRQAMANTVADVARQYAGDPEASDYSTGSLPALRNTEIANQANLDVTVNSSSPDYNDDTDYTDGPTGVVADPCYNHPPGTDPISPGGGQWTDVRVKERNVSSLLGAVGLPLARTGARARVEIRPALSGHRFLPLAVPNNEITKVQVRYYNECTSTPTLLATRDLEEVPSANQGAVVGVGTLWGLPGASATNPAPGFDITLPSYGGCSQPYLPVGVEVRIASRDEINFDTNTCAQLLAMQYADCFHRLSQIRIWNDGDPNNQARIGDVYLTGGCGNNGNPDAYFDTLPVTATDCRFGANVYVNWGARSTGNRNVPANFSVTVNGVSATLQGSLNGSGNGYGLWTVPSNQITANPGANTVTVALDWDDNNNSHNDPYSGQPCGGNRCEYSLSEPVQQAFVGTQGTAGAVAYVRTSASGWTGSPLRPSDPYATKDTGGNLITLYPTIGIRSVLKTGVYTTLRLDDPQANQTLQCDPNFAQGQEFSAFRYGCEPWYGVNHFNGDVLGPPHNTASWWNSSTKTCPDGGQWFSYSNQGAGFGVNSRNNPWRCVLTAPGMSTGQIGDDIAVATENCDNINNNSCQNFDCNYDGNYDGKPSDPTGWAQDGGVGGNTAGNPLKKGSAYPRVVNLFIVPYQASKGLTGAGDEIPVLGFASFYVMDWGGANSNQSDACPDLTFDHDKNPATPQLTMPRAPRGAITGVFVEAVDYEPGPVDPTAVCIEDQLTPCRVRLVR